MKWGWVAIPNLATVTNATIAVSSSYPTWSTKIVTNDLQPGNYFVAYQTDQPEDYQTRVRISNDGQNDASTSWGGVTQSGSHVYYEFNVPDDGKPYKVMIYSTPYNVNATKDIGISNVYVGKLSDQVGGVTKQLDIGSPTVWKGVSVVDTIQLAKYSASGAHDEQEVLTYHLGQKLEPSTKYRISFVARGSGDLNIYLFPGVAPSQDGQRSDGRIITSLTGDFRDYSYEVTTYAKFFGDSDKQLLFRSPADSKAGWVDIYIGSIRVEKVGGGS